MKFNNFICREDRVELVGYARPLEVTIHIFLEIAGRLMYGNSILPEGGVLLKAGFEGGHHPCNKAKWNQQAD